jgi:hemerythrin-like domain-containing protein
VDRLEAPRFAHTRRRDRPALRGDDAQATQSLVMRTDRRTVLGAAVAGGLAMVVPLHARARTEDKAVSTDKPQETEPKISAPEDLMREHGVLDRLLLVYEQGVRRLRAGEDVPPDVLHAAAETVRRFVEDYHERLEEQFILPRFDHGPLGGLATILREQHRAGRLLTDRLLGSTGASRFGSAGDRRDVVQACEAFIRMYRPHEAREDTVLFPALYRVVPAREVAALGERFEEQEHRLFGEGGFARTVESVGGLERRLGIHDLAKFTPTS